MAQQLGQPNERIRVRLMNPDNPKQFWNRTIRGVTVVDVAAQLMMLYQGDGPDDTFIQETTLDGRSATAGDESNN